MPKPKMSSSDAVAKKPRKEKYKERTSHTRGPVHSPGAPKQQEYFSDVADMEPSHTKDEQHELDSYFPPPFTKSTLEVFSAPLADGHQATDTDINSDLPDFRFVQPLPVISLPPAETDYTSSQTFVDPSVEMIPHLSRSPGKDRAAKPRFSTDSSILATRLMGLVEWPAEPLRRITEAGTSPHLPAGDDFQHATPGRYQRQRSPDDRPSSKHEEDVSTSFKQNRDLLPSSMSHGYEWTGSYGEMASNPGIVDLGPVSDSQNSAALSDELTLSWHQSSYTVPGQFPLPLGRLEATIVSNESDPYGFSTAMAEPGSQSPDVSVATKSSAISTTHGGLAEFSTKQAKSRSIPWSYKEAPNAPSPSSSVRAEPEITRPSDVSSTARRYPDDKQSKSSETPSTRFNPFTYSKRTRESEAYSALPNIKIESRSKSGTEKSSKKSVDVSKSEQWPQSPTSTTRRKSGRAQEAHSSHEPAISPRGKTNQPQGNDSYGFLEQTAPTPPALAGPEQSTFIHDPYSLGIKNIKSPLVGTIYSKEGALGSPRPWDEEANKGGSWREKDTADYVGFAPESDKGPDEKESDLKSEAEQEDSYYKSVPTVKTAKGSDGKRFNLSGDSGGKKIMTHVRDRIRDWKEDQKEAKGDSMSPGDGSLGNKRTLRRDEDWHSEPKTSPPQGESIKHPTTQSRGQLREADAISVKDVPVNDHRQISDQLGSRSSDIAVDSTSTRLSKRQHRPPRTGTFQEDTELSPHDYHQQARPGEEQYAHTFPTRPQNASHVVVPGITKPETSNPFSPLAQDMLPPSDTKSAETPQKGLLTSETRDFKSKTDAISNQQPQRRHPRLDEQQQKEKKEVERPEKITRNDNHQSSKKQPGSAPGTVDKDVQSPRNRAPKLNAGLEITRYETQERQPVVETEAREKSRVRQDVHGLESELRKSRTEKNNKETEVKKKVSEAKDAAILAKDFQSKYIGRKTELEDARTEAIRGAPESGRMGGEHVQAAVIAATADLHQPIRELEQKVESGEAKLHALNKEAGEKQATHQDQLSRLKRELAATREQSKNQREQLVKERGMASGLRAEMSRLQGDVEREKALGQGSSSSEDSELRREQSPISQLEAKITAMGEALQTSETRTRQLSQSLSSMETDARRAKGECQNHQKELDEEKTAVAKLTQGLQVLETKLGDASRDKSDLERQLATRTQELAEVQDSAKRANQRAKVEAQSRQSLQEELARLKLEIRGSRSEISDLGIQLEWQGKELAKARDAAIYSSQMGATEMDKVNGLQEEVKRLGSEVQAAYLSNSKLLEQLEQQRRESTLAQDEAVEGRRKRAVEVEKSRVLQKEVDSLKSKAQEARTKLREMAGQLEQERKELAQVQRLAVEQKAIEAEKAQVLQKQVDYLKSEAQAVGAELSKVKGLLEQKGKVSSAIGQQTTIEAEESRGLQLKVESLTLEIQKAQSEMGKLTGQLEQQTEQLTDSRREKEAIAQEISALARQREVETELSRNKISELTEQVQRKKDELARASQLTQDVASREEKVQRQLEDLEKERSSLAEKLERWKRTLQNSLGKERSPRESAEAAEENQSILQKRMVELSKSVQELTDSGKKERDELRWQLQQSIGRERTFEVKVATLGRDLEEARTQVHILKKAPSQNKVHESSLQELQRELQRSHDQSQDLKKGFEEREAGLERKLHKAQSQLDQSHGVTSNLEMKLKQSTQGQDELHAQISFLTDQLDTEIQERRKETTRQEALIVESQRQADSERKRADGLTGQLQQLREKVEDMRLQLENQRLQILDKQSRLETHKAEAAKLDAAKRKLEVNAESDRKTIESLRATHQAIASGARDKANQELIAQVELSREEVKKLSGRIEDQDRRLRVQDAYIAKVQIVAWERVKEAAKEKNTVVDDEELAAKFQIDVESRAQQWAAKYKARGADLTWSQDAIQGMGRELEKVTGMVQRDPAAFCRRYDLDLVVHALLSSFVTEHIFQNPFLLFELQAGADFARLMVKVYHVKLKADPPAAHKWRYSQLLWLGASSQEKPAKPSPSVVPDALKQNNPASKGYFSNLANQFVNGPAKVLLSEHAFSTAAIQTIDCLLRNAAQAAFLVWRQPMEIQIRDFEQLKGLQFPLAEDGDGMAETHRRQTGPAARAATRPDVVVDMVVQPAVVGKQENGDEKVWCRGVVLWN